VEWLARLAPVRIQSDIAIKSRIPCYARTTLAVIVEVLTCE